MIPEAARQLIECRSFECLLLVHPQVDRLHEIRAEILTLTSLSEINIGQELSRYLLDKPRADRGRLIQDWLIQQLNTASEKAALLSNVAILFEPEFNLDPLALFRHAGRRKPVVVLWPGEFSNGILTYAVPDHRHFRLWHSPAADVYTCGGVKLKPAA